MKAVKINRQSTKIVNMPNGVKVSYIPHSRELTNIFVALPLASEYHQQKNLVNGITITYSTTIHTNFFAKIKHSND